MSGFDAPVRILRDYIASAIDLVIHMVRLPDGRRIIEDVSEVVGHDGDRIRLDSLHRFRIAGAVDGRTEGAFEITGTVPGFLERIRARGVELDSAVFETNVRSKEVTT